MASADVDVVVLEHATMGENKKSCCSTGPGYATPLDAMVGPRESLIYVTCVYTGIYIFHLIKV